MRLIGALLLVVFAPIAISQETRPIDSSESGYARPIKESERTREGDRPQPQPTNPPKEPSGVALLAAELLRQGIPHEIVSADRYSIHYRLLVNPEKPIVKVLRAHHCQGNYLDGKLRAARVAVGDTNWSDLAMVLLRAAPESRTAENDEVLAVYLERDLCFRRFVCADGQGDRSCKVGHFRDDALIPKPEPGISEVDIELEAELSRVSEGARRRSRSDEAGREREELFSNRRASSPDFDSSLLALEREAALQAEALSSAKKSAEALNRQSEPRRDAGVRRCARPAIMTDQEAAKWQADCHANYDRAQNPNSRSGSMEASRPSWIDTTPVTSSVPGRPLTGISSNTALLSPPPTVQQHGQTTVQCVTLEFPEGRAQFRNACPFKVNVSYCIDKPSGWYRCKNNPPSQTEGMDDIPPNSVHSIPFYKSDGGGTVYPTYCQYPESASSFEVRSDKLVAFTCRK